nr:S24 family peptidase [uncultured Prevotella sp.]
MSEKPLSKSELLLSNAELLPEIVKLLNEGHTVTLKLKGKSMRPFLEDNRDMALLTKPKQIEEGEPVLAEIEPGHYVLHRIVKLRDENITLLGDGNLTPEHCTKQNVVGTVIGFYRKSRTELDKIDGKKWKTYSYIWMHLYPIRRYILALYRRIWIPLFGAI